MSKELLKKINELENHIFESGKVIDRLRFELSGTEKDIKKMQDVLEKKDIVFRRLEKQFKDLISQAEKRLDSRHQSKEYFLGDTEIFIAYGEDGLKTVKEGLK